MRPLLYPFNRATLSLLVILLLSALTFQSHAQSGSVTMTQSFSYTGQIVTWTVPTGVTSLTIESRGAEGGDVDRRTNPAGKGAVLVARVDVSPGQSLSILVGQQNSGRSGGGGGSFVVGPGSPGSPKPLVIAGGGGGAGAASPVSDQAKHGQLGQSGGAGGAGNGAGAGGNSGAGGDGGGGGGGGGGLLGDGGGNDGAGGKAFINGGTPGNNGRSFGSFGGGGTGQGQGGGAGGYSGGGTGGGGNVGGGGGSITTGDLLSSRTGATDGNSGNGLVIISYSISTIRYVKPGGTGDGTSWDNASGDLQSQINIAGAQQVWVAGGRYTTTANNGSFSLKNGVSVYGGFAGSEQNLTDRPGVNPVNGQLSSTTLTATSRSVFSNNGLDNTARLDGVVITGGDNIFGGGIYNSNSSPVLTNCLISGNTTSDAGGGIYNANSSPVLTNCLISGNSASNRGGGIYTENGIPSLTNCVISGNSADQGGGISNYSSSPSLTNCTISSNTASSQGGGIYNRQNSSPVLTNCLLANNTATNQGGAFHNYQSSNPRLVNCTLTGNSAGDQGGAISEDRTASKLTNAILWNNGGAKAFRFLNGGSTSLTYSLIESGATGYTSSPTNQTATVSPFMSGTDFTLRAGSQAIDAGDPASTTATSGPTDLGGNPRVLNGRIDMGAYEFQGPFCQPVAITQQPVSGSSVTAGASVSVPVSVSGTVSGYQWYKDNLNSPVTGQISATLTLTNVQPGDAGSYSLVVTGACNSATSTAFSLSVLPAQPIRYVKQGGTGDGTSWTNASGDLQSQIDLAGAEQVWVAGGRYTRANGGSFSLKNGVAVYGGFVGNETSLRPALSPVNGQPSSTTLTVSSGSVFRNTNLDNTARLDGVVITGGNSGLQGGGIFNVSSSPSLTNCVISGNSATGDGGGISNNNSSPSLTNCVISGNSGPTQGGGISNFSSSPSLTNCVISGNSADQGGGIFNFSSSPSLTGCLISGNSTSLGGGFYNAISSPRLINCTLTANRAVAGAALINYTDSQPVLTNTILWDNQEAANTAINNDTGTGVTANYCLIGQGETDFTGSNNLTATSSPFVSSTNFMLRAGSPAIDAGDPASTTATTGANDLAGNPRVANNRIDIGAYEFQGPFCQPIAITRQPASGSSVCAGTTVTAMVSVTGTSPTYQWYKDGQALTSVTSATTATLILTNVQTSQKGSYSVVVTGTCPGSVTSTAFSLTVNALPSVSITPATQTICQGQSATFTAQGASTYQWSTGQTSPGISVSATDTYSVTGTTSGCSATATASLTVNPVPTAPMIATQSGHSYPGGVSSLTIAQNVGNVILMVSGCAGGTITWAGGNSNTLAVSTFDAGRQTFTATCTQNGCSSPPATATVTVVPTTLSVLHRDGNGNVNTNTLAPYLELQNDGNTPIPYAEITVRYWLTVENYAPLLFAINYAQLGSDKVHLKYVPAATGNPKATGYIEFSFDASAGSLGAMSNSGPIQDLINKQDYSSFDQSNDYSYVNTGQYTPNPRITAYRNGVIFYGMEPGPVVPMQSVKAMLQNNTGADANSIEAVLSVTNDGNIPINYGDIKVRYYFTVDNTQPLVLSQVGYTALGSGNVSAQIVTISPPLTNADRYLELSFSPGLGQLAPGASTGGVTYQIRHADYSGFNQTNDYSYQGTGGTMVNPHVVVFVAGKRAYGSEPTSGARQGVEETGKLSVSVLGNPITGSTISVSVRGAEGQALRYELTDVSGHVVGERQVEQAGAVDEQSLSVGHQPAGLLLLRVSTPTQSQTVKVLRQ